MTVYKRGRYYWADFVVGGRRVRISLKTTDRRQALAFEKLRIAEVQTGGERAPRKTTKLTVAEAAEFYFTRRLSEVSASTIRLERDAAKQVLRHTGTNLLGDLTSNSLTGYVSSRHSEGIANRTINIEVGVLRRILKQHKLWAGVGEGYKPLPERKDVGRALSPEQELRLFTVASSRPEWSVAFWVSLVAANTTAGGCELRNLRVRDIDVENRMMYVRVGKNRFRVRAIPLNQTATWGIENLLARARDLGATSSDHFVVPRRLAGKRYDPTQPPSRWAWRSAWRKLTEEAGLVGLRPHDLRHHAITKLAESPASEQTIMAIAGHVSREMLEHYSHIRQEAKRKALEALDHVTITSQFAKWEADAQKAKERKPAKTKEKIGRDGQI
jgi:integrase